MVTPLPELALPVERLVRRRVRKAGGEWEGLDELKPALDVTGAGPPSGIEGPAGEVDSVDPRGSGDDRAES